jgi:signal transduction histidine kinase
MKIEDYILTTYPIIHPYDGANSKEIKLKEKNYLVVMDENSVFYGILTPADIITRPHKLVIDCLTPKKIIQTDDSFAELVNKFEKTPSDALPVFRHDEYVGIFEKANATKKLKSLIDDFRNESLVSQRAKKEFFQNLFHEVRTPLNQILGFMSIIAELSPEEIEQKRESYFEIIQKSSEQFLSTMDNLIERSYYNS